MRTPYIRAVGLMQEVDGDGRNSTAFSKDDEIVFLKMAQDGELYNKITQSLCPEIFGSDDIKRSIACMLFGGSRKMLQDGMKLRGDVNVLLLGDPGTAKSQLLKVCLTTSLSPVMVFHMWVACA